ncbi:MAG TPA: hypothetical protein VNW71_13655 [Thermoanaerobaculia bacterium]|nr:hypothetical protein [Thermoanaerobaculia bacterium]
MSAALALLVNHCDRGRLGVRPAQRDRGVLGLRHGADQGFRVAGDLAEQGEEEIPVGEHPLLVRLVGVHLHQDRRPVAQRVIAGRVARRADPGAEALARIVAVLEVHVRSGPVAGLLGGGEDRRHVLAQPEVHRERRLGSLGPGPGQDPVVIDPVRHMVVHVQVGPPLGHQLHESLGLRGGDLQMVAVEVQAGGGGAEAHALARPVLVGPVVRGDPLVAVHVVDRQDDQDHLVEQLAVQALGQVAEDHQAGILAVDLPAVNAVLDHHDRLAGPQGRGRGEGLVLGDHHERHLQPPGGFAEGADLHLGRLQVQQFQVDER